MENLAFLGISPHGEILRESSMHSRLRKDFTQVDYTSQIFAQLRRLSEQIDHKSEIEDSFQPSPQKTYSSLKTVALIKQAKEDLEGQLDKTVRFDELQGLDEEDQLTACMNLGIIDPNIDLIAEYELARN